MGIRGVLVNRTWLRRPELSPVETKEHKVHKGLFFQLGRDPDTGLIDVRRVDYPESWSMDRIREAILNREHILQTEGCEHCSIKNKQQILDRVRKPNNNKGSNDTYILDRFKDTSKKVIASKRLLPGKRPFRDWLATKS